MSASATGRRLQDPKGGSFFFDAGAVCLDFAHTGGEGPYAKFESLHAPGDLAAWLASPPLSADVVVSDDELAAALRLRQAIWVAAHAAAGGVAVPAVVVAAINAAAAEPCLVPQLGAGWGAPTAPQVLSTLARELIALLSGPSADRIRECDGDRCPLVFVDLSRPGSRRWCSMERCGNRHKVRTHRARQA